MNESSNPKTMYEAVPAVAELNKVPGFDPLKFLRRTKDSMRLDLPYQKLWFRMAHPNGRTRDGAADHRTDGDFRGPGVFGSWRCRAFQHERGPTAASGQP